MMHMEQKSTLLIMEGYSQSQKGRSKDWLYIVLFLNGFYFCKKWLTFIWIFMFGIMCLKVWELHLYCFICVYIAYHCGVCMDPR